MAHQQSTRVEPAGDWVRDDVRAVLRGEGVEAYPYDAIQDLDGAIADFTMRQMAYAASIASGAERLAKLARAPDDERMTSAAVPTAKLGKRLFDIIIATAALIILAPILIAIALAIKLESRGPTLFRQMRVGRDGWAFTIYKFRTLSPRAEMRKVGPRLPVESAGVFDMLDDITVTRAGRLLRRTSLDELPGLFNVLRGDMSLVGPRPLMEKQAEAIPAFERHPSTTLRPGMISITARPLAPAEALALADRYATARWSVLLDLRLLMCGMVRFWRHG